MYILFAYYLIDDGEILFEKERIVDESKLEEIIKNIKLKIFHEYFEEDGEFDDFFEYTYALINEL